MAQEYSFDIVSQFDAQELRNAVDQVKREIQNRYDFKGTNTEVTLNEDDINVVAQDTMKLKAVADMLFQKMINRGLSPKLLDIQEHEPGAQGMIKQLIKLKKTLNQEQCKAITKLLKEKFSKIKTSIQGDTVRVSSKDKDELQTVISFLKGNTQIDAPLQFTNYR
jgi:cyclic-di-GMP-binding protein